MEGEWAMGLDGLVAREAEETGEAWAGHFLVTLFFSSVPIPMFRGVIPRTLRAAHR